MKQLYTETKVGKESARYGLEMDTSGWCGSGLGARSLEMSPLRRQKYQR